MEPLLLLWAPAAAAVAHVENSARAAEGYDACAAMGTAMDHLLPPAAVRQLILLKLGGHEIKY